MAPPAAPGAPPVAPEAARPGITPARRSAANRLAPTIIPSSSASTPTTTTRKRAQLDGAGGVQHRRDARLHVRAPAPPQDAVDDVTGERVEGPGGRVALGDHVDVPLEHQGAAGPLAVDHPDDAVPTRRGLDDGRRHPYPRMRPAIRSTAGLSTSPGPSCTVRSRTSAAASSTTAAGSNSSGELTVAALCRHPAARGTGRARPRSCRTRVPAPGTTRPDLAGVGGDAVGHRVEQIGVAANELGALALSDAEQIMEDQHLAIVAGLAPMPMTTPWSAALISAGQHVRHRLQHDAEAAGVLAAPCRPSMIRMRPIRLRPARPVKPPRAADCAGELDVLDDGDAGGDDGARSTTVRRRLLLALDALDELDSPSGPPGRR